MLRDKMLLICLALSCGMIACDKKQSVVQQDAPLPRNDDTSATASPDAAPPPAEAAKLEGGAPSIAALYMQSFDALMKKDGAAIDALKLPAAVRAERCPAIKLEPPPVGRRDEIFTQCEELFGPRRDASRAVISAQSETREDSLALREGEGCEGGKIHEGESLMHEVDDPDIGIQQYFLVIDEAVELEGRWWLLNDPYCYLLAPG